MRSRASTAWCTTSPQSRRAPSSGSKRLTPEQRIYAKYFSITFIGGLLAIFLLSGSKLGVLMPLFYMAAVLWPAEKYGKTCKGLFTGALATIPFMLAAWMVEMFHH